MLALSLQDVLGPVAEVDQLIDQPGGEQIVGGLTSLFKKFIPTIQANKSDYKRVSHLRRLFVQLAESIDFGFQV